MKQMSVARLTGAIEGEALRAELVAALGPESSETWSVAYGVREATVQFTDTLAAKVQAVLDAHLTPEAISRREVKGRALPQAISVGGAAREERQLRRLALKDPIAALLRKAGLR